MSGTGKRGDKRQERLAAELRANLKKRKEQARARAQSGDVQTRAPGPAPPPESGD